MAYAAICLVLSALCPDSARSALATGKTFELRVACVSDAFPEEATSFRGEIGDRGICAPDVDAYVACTRGA